MFFNRENLGSFHLLINYLSSVLVVIVNKVLFSKYAFQYGAILSAIHFVITFIGIIIFSFIGSIELKKVHFVPLLGLSIVYALSVPFCSLSICHNSLGFYQISKTLIIPFTICFERIWFKQPLRLNMVFYVLPILVGSYITAGTDINLNTVGVLFSIGCIVTSGISQKWIQIKQEELKLNSFQILIYLMPLSIIMQTISIPALDNVIGDNGIIYYKFGVGVLVLILLSAILALTVNISLFLSLKQISPLSYQIVGQLKSVTIIVISFLFFGQNQDLKNIFGISLTLTGVYIYTYIKYVSIQPINENK